MFIVTEKTVKNVSTFNIFLDFSDSFLFTGGFEPLNPFFRRLRGPFQYDLPPFPASAGTLLLL